MKTSVYSTFYCTRSWCPFNWFSRDFSTYDRKNGRIPTFLNKKFQKRPFFIFSQLVFCLQNWHKFSTFWPTDTIGFFKKSGFSTSGQGETGSDFLKIQLFFTLVLVVFREFNNFHFYWYNGVLRNPKCTSTLTTSKKRDEIISPKKGIKPYFSSIFTRIFPKTIVCPFICIQ